MKEVIFVAILSYFLAAVLIPANADRDTDICRIFPNNTIIRDPDSCDRYITCINFVSHYSECKGSTPFFNKDTQKCVKTIDDDTSCSISCSNAVNRFIADPKSCYGYYYCADENTPQHGYCPDETHFNQTRQECTRKYESNCTPEDFEYCSIVKNGINFNDERRCDTYFTCAKGKLTNPKCKDKYYQVITGTCVEKSQVQCNEHPVPTDACGTEKKPKKNEFVSDGATCAGYFFCAEQTDGKPDPNPRWGHCPKDFFFDSSSKSCKDALDVKCTWDRCDGRTLPFVLSATKGCRNYLRCIDGITYDEKNCGNMFFDEVRNACVSDIIKLPVCS